jgi:hypothetical protein
VILNGPQMQADATMRYLTDPAFHARVGMAVELAKYACRQATGIELSQHGYSVAVQTAAFAIMVAEVELTEGVLEQAEEDMKEAAEQFGFTAVKRNADEA